MKTILLFVFAAMLFSACCGLPGVAPQENQSGPVQPGASNYPPPASPSQLPVPPATPATTPPSTPPASASCSAAELESLLQSFNSSRAVAENNCSVITRTDTYPCTDTDSCQLACYGSWLCRQVAWSSNIIFINQIRDWRSNESKLNLAYARVLNGMANSDAQAARQGLREMKEAAQAIETFPLYTEHSFCPQQQFNWNAFNQAEGRLGSACPQWV